MNQLLQYNILQCVFQDNKQRTILAITPFGDLLFKVDNEQGETFKFLQIYISDNNSEREYNFEFKLHILGETIQEYESFINQGALRNDNNLSST